MTETPQAPDGQPGGRPEQESSTGSTDSAQTAPIAHPTAVSPETPVTSATRAASPAEQQPPQAPGVTAAPQGASFGAAAYPAADTAERPKRRTALPVIAALAIGALVGGTSGATIALLANQSNSTQTVSQSSPTSPNVTVNRTADATTVTAVAAEASPSVVTIAVSGTNSAGTGSGIVLSADGYILTNNHVVTLDGAVADPLIHVTANDGRIYSATVVGTDPIVDLAVIKLDGASGLTPMTFGNSDQLNVGDSAIAIGAPLGLSGTVTDGIVSALNRSITVASSAVPDSSGSSTDQNGSAPNDFWNFDLPGQTQTTNASSSIALPVIQTDAAINPGNSGGALLNSSGDLIGVNVAIASAGSTSGGQSGSIGVGFAIPANLAKRVADEIVKNGAATHGLLGATVADVTAVDDKATNAGAYLDEVSSGGAAEAAGLKHGDVITQFNGVAITSQTDLTAQVRFLAAGSSAKLTYVRDGKAAEATVTLGTLGS
ncbi:MAG: serine protease [Naasia sp.]|jgi:putative serine protease PepD|uniref:S1C family serine protease n=1 Tax=Naasia sp. TaxID=2546198 RepID=UPI0026136C79|nr:trypsin-like peptidase domain-containing protein [Naasia sp.]MCU1571503.1 serine protease [Naasia sp.]